MFLVKLWEVKNSQPREFTITGAFASTVDRYISLRSPNTFDERFFVNYRDKKCTIQVIGKTKLSKMPERIASFLELPNANEFSGWFFSFIVDIYRIY